MSEKKMRESGCPWIMDSMESKRATPFKKKRTVFRRAMSGVQELYTIYGL
jgi:hypothetical protein